MHTFVAYTAVHTIERVEQPECMPNLVSCCISQVIWISAATWKGPRLKNNPPHLRAFVVIGRKGGPAEVPVGMASIDVENFRYVHCICCLDCESVKAGEIPRTESGRCRNKALSIPSTSEPSPLVPSACLRVEAAHSDAPQLLYHSALSMRVVCEKIHNGSKVDSL